MASAITFSVQPGNITPSITHGSGTTDTTTFTVNGDDAETLVCTLSATDLSSGELALFKDNDKSTNPTDTLVADIATTCNDNAVSTITLTIEASDTDSGDTRKTFGTNSGHPVTLNVSYV